MDNKKIVLATHNAGKLRELSTLLGSRGFEVVGLNEFPGIYDIEETGSSFEENALIKAETIARLTGLISIADDSGLEVEALGGAPGIYSARYGDDWEKLKNESRDERNIRKLLNAMRGKRNRNCRFVTAIAAVRPDGVKMTRFGKWDGILLDKPAGNNGFGYDPVFFDPLLGKSAAELPPEIKNSHSHRNAALTALLSDWDSFLAQNPA